MKIYLLTYDNTEKFPECSISDSDPWNDEPLGEAEEIKNNLELPIKFQVDNKYPLNDKPYCARQFLVSSKFANILKTLTNEYQEFTAEIYKKDKLITKDYIVFEFTSCSDIIQKR